MITSKLHQYLLELAKNPPSQPVDLLYSYDHFIMPTEEGEPSACLFYMTVDGWGCHAKVINGRVVFKYLTFGVSRTPYTDRERLIRIIGEDIELNEQSALGLVTLSAAQQLSKSRVPDILENYFANLTYLLKGLNLSQLITLKNQTGVWVNAYPPTEDIIDVLKILEARQS